MVCSQEPRIQVSEHNVDHREMLIRLGLITSGRHGCMPVTQLVQTVVASPPVGPHFRAHLNVSQYHRFQRFLLAVRDNLEAQPARYKTATVSSSMLRTLARW
jgi:hypothetical protein